MAADPPAGRRPRQCPVGDVSVIIPTRDAEPWLAAAVASVLAQGRRIGEVMICTDAADSPHRLGG